MPEDPVMLDTKFYLFRRDTQNFSSPDILLYDEDKETLLYTKINYSLPLKMIIHGYLGKWNDVGILMGAESYLKIYDCNMILMDWSRGARGPQYSMAAANTEVVGRQLGILLLKLVQNGLWPENIHLLGFSLGAHVAGTASEVLKQEGYLIGRITGLDAASPLFRSDLLREKNKKLDKDDARFVDVVHTDASPSITDGFGLWKPIGHVDFFPNGGQDQPGCNDTKQSVVLSHFDRALTINVACSHIRAWRLYLETLVNKAAGNQHRCEFTAFSCRGGLKSFEQGFCFPQLPSPNNSQTLTSYRNDIGRFGEDVKGEGVMFFATKGVTPYCGTQIHASIHVAPKTGAAKGYFILNLKYPDQSVAFFIDCDLDDSVLKGTVMSGLAVANYGTLQDVVSITANLKFTDLNIEENNGTAVMFKMYIDKIVIRDMFSNSWQYCNKNTILTEDANKLNDFTLINKNCF